MTYTMISRNESGEFKQRWYVDTVIEKAIEISKYMFIDNSIHVQIYEDRVPKGDFYGKPVAVVKKNGEVIYG